MRTITDFQKNVLGKAAATLVLLLAVLVSSSFLACNSAGSKTADTASAATTGEAETDNGATSGSEAVPVAHSPADKIGHVTTVSGATLPSGMSVDYTAGTHTAPMFSWENGVGETGSLADYKGKVVMLNFWGTWCPPCRRELPDLVRLREKHAEKGFEIIGIALERPSSTGTMEEHLAAFAEHHGLEYPLILANQEINLQYGGIQAVPTTFIVNRDGKVVDMLVGGMSEVQFQAALDAVM